MTCEFLIMCDQDRFCREPQIESPLPNADATVTIAPTARIYPNVRLGAGTVVGDWCIIGEPPRGRTAGELPTVIGPGAVIRSHTVIYAGNTIGADFQTGHGALLREENTIGDHVSIGSHTVIEHHLTIGNHARIHSSAFLPEYTILEERTWIGPHVVFTNVLHPMCHGVSHCIKGPVIRRGAKIGAAVTILPHVEIGEMTVIGSGSVVVDSMPARSVVVGTPGRVVKSIDEIECPWQYVQNPYPLPGDPRTTNRE